MLQGWSFSAVDTSNVVGAKRSTRQALEAEFTSMGEAKVDIHRGILRAAIISEINSVFVDAPQIVAHNDESSSATSRQYRQTCVTLIHPRFRSPKQAGSSNT
ncbi:hypothetical protein BJV77DRAFT_1050932, partial [Russula vinacea]